MLRFTLLVVAFAIVEAANRLPDYIVPCSLSDPNFKQCAVDQGNKAIPKIANGDKKIKLRQLDPLFIPEIRIDTSSNLKLVLTDVSIVGLSKIILRDIDFDDKKRMVALNLFADQLEVLGDYTIDGKILILPIQGSGKINVTVVKGDIGYGFDFDLVDKNGEQYVKPHSPKVSLKSQRYYFQLDNLFNGDPRLGPEVNQFLNENYHELEKELNPSVTETIGTIAADIVETVMTLVPYNELLLP